jgi:hypothetical protein
LRKLEERKVSLTRQIDEEQEAANGMAARRQEQQRADESEKFIETNRKLQDSMTRIQELEQERERVVAEIDKHAPPARKTQSAR